MKKYGTILLILLAVLLISYIFYPKTVKKAVIDNTSLKNFNEETKVIAPLMDKESASLNALNKLSEDTSKGFTEVPKEIKFYRVTYDPKNKLATIYARFEGSKEHMGSFQESKMLLQIFQTVKANIPESEKFKITFDGESPFTELKADGIFQLDGENIILAGE